MRAYRSLIVMLAGAVMAAACGGGGVAPVVERGTGGAAGGQSAGTSRGSAPNAGSEAGTSDWTATVRPLGDSGSTASRELPIEEPLAATAATSEPGPAPPSTPRSRQPGAAAANEASSATVNPAVVSLLNTASAQSRAGDHTRAAATLERAIAIEPDNAWLWHRLATARLKEGRLEQAAALAARSNSFAQSPATADHSVQADNWKLIAEVRRRQGDTGAAAAAESRATKLSN